MFLALGSHEVAVLQWDAQEEDFINLSVTDPEQAERYSLGVHRYEFEEGLGPYPSEQYKAWLSLSHYISKGVLSVLEPLSKKISSLYDTSHDDPRISAHIQQLNLQHEETLRKRAPLIGHDTETTPPLEAPSSPISSPPPPTPVQSHQPYFSELRARVTATTPQGVSQQHMDKTATLQHIMKRYENDPNGVLGELQFAFICFLLGQSFDGFEQWKNMIALLCTCERGMREMPRFFSDFFDVLHAQLQHIPEDFFVDALSGRNFLTRSLKDLFELTSDSTLSTILRKRAQLLRQLAEERFKVSFDPNQLQLGQEGEEEDEDAPTVVEGVE